MKQSLRSNRRGRSSSKSSPAAAQPAKAAATRAADAFNLPEEFIDHEAPPPAKRPLRMEALAPEERASRRQLAADTLLGMVPEALAEIYSSLQEGLQEEKVAQAWRVIDAVGVATPKGGLAGLEGVGMTPILAGAVQGALLGAAQAFGLTPPPAPMRDATPSKPGGDAFVVPGEDEP